MNDFTGGAAPSFVLSCILENTSDDDVKVRIKFKVLEGGNNFRYDTFDTDIPAGDSYQVERRTTDDGFNQVVDSIEVIRADGQTQKLTAPFDGVYSIEVDWPFVIDNLEIRSVDKNS